MTRLYPPVEPYASGLLPVSAHHTIYYEQVGSPAGKPALCLHGGPGGGIDPRHRQFFDPQRYRLILFDQRGCGRSRPSGSLDENTTWDLIADIEKLRIHLGIDRWLLFGGSWGSTLALAYAQLYPERISQMVLRGIFTFAEDEVAWFLGVGSATIFPDPWELLVAALPAHERNDILAAYHRRLTSPDPAERNLAASAWSRWECSLGHLVPDEELIAACAQPGFGLSFARIECHYLVNRGFFTGPRYLLQHMERLEAIPGILIHGRYDIVCPLRNAWRLHQAWPTSRLEIVEAAGHSAQEPGISAALLRATDSFVGTGSIG